MRIAILGTGPMGAYFGLHLAQAGEDVAFLARSTYEPIKRNGLKLESPDGDIHLPAPQMYREPAECGPADLVLVSWKSFLNHQFAKSLPPLLHRDTMVLTIQNGMGNAEAISAFVPPENIAVALCYSTCMPVAPGVFRHVGGNDTRLAPMASSAAGQALVERLATVLQKAGIRVSFFESMEGMLWRKLLLNIPFNGVSLANGGLNGAQLEALPGAVDRMRGIMEEVYRAAELRGHALPPESVGKEMKRIHHMAQFTPSSSQDFLRGRPVEYDAIWGIPLQHALEAGAPVPLWQELCRDIQRRIAR